MTHRQYIIANAKQIKKTYSKNKIPPPNLIISSPPYFDLLNYDNNKDQIGYGQKDYNIYLNEVCKVFQDCYDISKPNATFWMVTDTFKKNKEVRLLPFDIVNKLKSKTEKTWILRDIIIWDKGKNLPWSSKGNFKNQHEYILLFTKGNNFKFKVDRIREILDLKKWWKSYPERYNPGGKSPSNVWNFTTPIRGWGHNKQNHLCPFPFPLIEKIISISSDKNDWVLDPFAGSGSVLAIAQEMNRNSIGLDINKRYKERFEKEVILGAEYYWSKRKKEIEDSKILFKNFKSLNKKLRKLKIANKICEHLNNVNKHQFLYYTKDKPNYDIDVIILQNGKMPKVHMKNAELNDLIKQAQVNANILIEKDVDFIKKNSKVKSYKYKYGKFYSYTSQCKLKNASENKDKYDYIYSDIGIKINEV